MSSSSLSETAPDRRTLADPELCVVCGVQFRMDDARMYIGWPKTWAIPQRIGPMHERCLLSSREQALANEVVARALAQRAAAQEKNNND